MFQFCSGDHDGSDAPSGVRTRLRLRPEISTEYSDDAGAVLPRHCASTAAVADLTGEDDSAQLTKDFYEEYRSVCDMTAEFYLQTVEEVFQKHSLPNNELEHRGKVIDLGDIKQTALLAVEGERDDISGIGQTKAALPLARNLSEDKKRYYMAEGAGHYGIFNGSKWRTKVAPVVEQFIATHG